MKLFRSIITISAAMLLAACTMTVRNDVSSFHHLPAPTGESVAIVPMSLSVKSDSLEFQEYAELISRQLVMLGYTVAESKEEAELIVELGYQVKRERNNYRAPFNFSYAMYDPRYRYSYGFGYHNWYYWRQSAFFYNSFYDPFYGGFGRMHHTRPLNNRQLMLDIRSATGDKLYEGRVESLGTSRALAKVMPYMVEAMFTSFPGESGEVKQVVVREEEKSQ